MYPALIMLILACLLTLAALALLILVSDLLEHHQRRTAARRRYAAVRYPPPAAPQNGAAFDFGDAYEDDGDSSSPRERGEALLRRLLSESQRDEYQRHGWITVPLTHVPDTIYSYAQIGKGIRGVAWIPHSSRRNITNQCVYIDPTDDLVKADDLISKLLWLRADPVTLAKVSGLQLVARPFPDWFRAHMQPPPVA